ncbi:flavodoxin oxidoreductase [Thioalkalivibrio denitrificans]|uniref:Flavodoxin oxidoreductase n=1 Tax=Thioalkalivibrio denitrificans TaxID=108003 RepID=A0A1V3NJG7_9GAMM|nr:2Fe-2S iron-sulfur cluster-binding protein [Thioalkalivibrio denitrificans]OOG25210.1 flavodoxin oxidoreductase [Thioalkalivibrio denitrificans]
MSSWTVRLVSGDHSFPVEGEETVVEAALRAGIAISYGCTNGSCGDCRARVVSGQVKKVRAHDYALTETEKLAGYALLCSVTPESDLVVDTNVAEHPDQIPMQDISTTVRGTERPNPDVLIMRLQTPRTRRLRFLAGQHVQLEMDNGAVSTTQPLANCPCDDRNLILHLNAQDDDPFVRHCFEQTRNGDTVEVHGPFGDFVLPDEKPRPLLFLAADTGFAPVRSLVEHVLAQENTEDIDLLWVANNSTGHYQGNLCRAWQDAIDNFHYRGLEWESGSDARSLRSLLDNALQGISRPADRYAFIAGPASFVQVAREAALATGVHPEHQRTFETGHLHIREG